MKRRLWFALALTIPLVALEMGGHLDRPRQACRSVSNWIEFALATPVALWAGWPFFVRALGVVRTRNLNMFTLIAIGRRRRLDLQRRRDASRPGYFPRRRPRRAAPVYFEAAAVITVLVIVGQVLELTAREKTGDAIRALLDLAPKRALRIDADGHDQEVALDEVAVGDGCACGRAKRSRSTARSSTARARSTNP